MADTLQPNNELKQNCLGIVFPILHVFISCVVIVSTIYTQSTSAMHVYWAGDAALYKIFIGTGQIIYRVVPHEQFTCMPVVFSLLTMNMIH